MQVPYLMPIYNLDSIENEIADKLIDGVNPADFLTIQREAIRITNAPRLIEKKNVPLSQYQHSFVGANPCHIRFSFQLPTDSKVDRLTCYLRPTYTQDWIGFLSKVDPSGNWAYGMDSPFARVVPVRGVVASIAFVRIPLVWNASSQYKYTTICKGGKVGQSEVMFKDITSPLGTAPPKQEVIKAVCVSFDRDNLQSPVKGPATAVSGTTPLRFEVKIDLAPGYETEQNEKYEYGLYLNVQGVGAVDPMVVDPRLFSFDGFRLRIKE